MDRGVTRHSTAPGARGWLKKITKRESGGKHVHPTGFLLKSIHKPIFNVK